VILATIISASLTGAGVVRVEPREVSWDLLQQEFDLRWVRPEHPGKGPNLVREVETLLQERFELRDDGRALTSFGDLAAAAADHPGRGRREWLDGLSKQDRELFDRRGKIFRELLCDDRLWDGWDPGDDDERDGFYHRSAWKAGGKLESPWKDLKEEAVFEQVAVFVHADLLAFKQAENDYRPYAQDVGANYDEIYPLEGSYLRGNAPDGTPFARTRIYWRADLPFPFDDYECELNLLNRVDSEGRLITDVYSTSADFHFMAGRDVFFPVEDSHGDWTGTLVVRVSGLDLAGVPDGGTHHRRGLRGSLGNIKRRAEPLFAARGSREVVAAGTVPAFELIGNR